MCGTDKNVIPETYFNTYQQAYLYWYVAHLQSILPASMPEFNLILYLSVCCFFERDTISTAQHVKSAADVD